MIEEQRDEQRDEAETERVAAEPDVSDADTEPDFELHGQFFNAPSE